MYIAMNKEESKKLLEKYLNAKTSISEEEALLYGENRPPELKPWSQFIKRESVKPPEGLKDTIWEVIEKRKRRKQQFFYGLSGMAASLILILTFVLNSKSEMGYAEKEALLNETLAMFNHQEQAISEQNIIFEDDTVVIYLGQE